MTVAARATAGAKRTGRTVGRGDFGKLPVAAPGADPSVRAAPGGLPLRR
jgi:hypothetical protein